jgi:ketosteroid isomerase-like protein
MPTKAALDSIAICRNAFSYLERPVWERGPNYRQVLFDSLSEDIEFSLASPEYTYLWGGTRHGLAEVMSLYNDSPWAAVVQNLGYQSVPEFFANDEGTRVVMLASEGLKILKTGVTVPKRDFAQVMDVHNGKITRVHIMQDHTEWNEAYAPPDSRQP